MAGQTSRRAGLIKAVHAEARRLGMDDDTRRAMQRAVAGKDSCAQMSEHELERVLAHLRSRGSRRPRPGEDRAPLVRKVYALLDGRPVSYAEAILHHMYGDSAPHHLEWANPTQLRALVAALVYDRKRRYVRYGR